MESKGLKAKLITQCYEHDFNNKMNDFFKNNDVLISDIKFSVNTNRYNALILYKEKEKKEEVI